MHRLVYSPKVQAWVKTDNGVIDLSPYLTRGEVTRKVNQVSETTLTFRNPNKVFTEGKLLDGSFGPMIHPMDPIVTSMTRLKGRPTQVFTGYVDSAPYLSLYPGEVSIKASCTLKRLQHTYWDPGLPFVHDFLRQYGWEAEQGLGGVVSLGGQGSKLADEKKFTDGSIANLLFATLKNVGGWDPDTIFIEDLPNTIVPLLAKIFDRYDPERKAAFEGLDDFLHKVIGTAALGNGFGSTSHTGTGSSLGGVGVGEWVKVGFTVDNFSGGPVACGKTFGGMSYAELGVAGANGGMSKSGGFLSDLFGRGKSGFGMPCGTKVEVRRVGGTKSVIVAKCDNGSGQSGDSYYKIDIEEPAANILGYTINDKGSVEIRLVK